MITQEQGTIATISAAANIFAGGEKQFCKFGIMNSKKLNMAARELMGRIGVSEIPLESTTGLLSFEDRKLEA
jgi:ribose transport system ATP-binding protein